MDIEEKKQLLSIYRESLKQLGVIEVRQGARGGSYVKKIDLDNVASQMQQVLQIHWLEIL